MPARQQQVGRNRHISLVLAAGGWLTGVMSIAFALVAAYGFHQHGWNGVAAAAMAAGLCWFAGTLALVMVALNREPEQVINAIGLAMIFRMGLPLIVGIFFTRRGGPLVEAGLFGMIVGFYLIGLIVETMLAVRLTARSKQDQVNEPV